MKQKRLVGILFFTILLWIYSSYCYGLAVQTSYIPIHEKERIQVGGLSFVDLTYQENGSSLDESFGLIGRITNHSKDEISYTSTVSFYDMNRKLIIQNTNTASVLAGESVDFRQMFSIDRLEGYTIDDIFYYHILVRTDSIKSEVMDTSSSEFFNDSNQNNSDQMSKTYDYNIQKYDIQMIVNENNTFDITETITAYFNKPKHGIYRTIPLKNTIERLDGTTSTNRAKVTNVSVNQEYTKSKENEEYQIKIGSASRTITGEQTYVIQYTYDIGKDPVKNYDELYYNLIGREWDTVIEKVTFTVVMPKEFDASQIGFSSGKFGSTNNDKVAYTVNGNKIMGSYEKGLSSYEALTIRCELPEGYFTASGLAIDLEQYWTIGIPILCFLIAFFLWVRYGRDGKIIKTVEFYPPEGLNSMEVGFLYKGKADSQDVVSLLIYLANKGYIKIEENEETSLFSKKKGFKIRKLKEYDGNNINEKIFLERLFRKKVKDSYVYEDEITSDDLYDSFYVTIDRILKNINTKENKNKIFETISFGKKALIIILIIVSYCFITIPPMVQYGQTVDLIMVALVIPGMGLSVMFAGIVAILRGVRRNGKSIETVQMENTIIMAWGILFWGLPFFFLVFPTFLIDFVYLIGYVIGVVCIISMLILFAYLPKRTPYGKEIFGKLKGFKHFLETAEKDRLEAMVMQNPSYFYDILPYTYALEISEKWVSKFESIALQAPSWYERFDKYDSVAFHSFIHSTMTTAQDVMASSPSRSSGGGSSSSSSSGGGSSGGGSGGGGGGSW